MTEHPSIIYRMTASWTNGGLMYEIDGKPAGRTAEQLFIYMQSREPMMDIASLYHAMRLTQRMGGCDLKWGEDGYWLRKSAGKASFSETQRPASAIYRNRKFDI